jgi:hypothetical protein
MPENNETPTDNNEKQQPWREHWPPTGLVKPSTMVPGGSIKGGKPTTSNSDTSNVWKIDDKDKLDVEQKIN